MAGVRTAPLVVLRSAGSPAYADRTASDQLPAGVQPSVKLSPAVASSTRLDIMGTVGFSAYQSEGQAEPRLRYQRSDAGRQPGP